MPKLIKKDGVWWCDFTPEQEPFNFAEGSEIEIILKEKNKMKTPDETEPQPEYIILDPKPRRKDWVTMVEYTAIVWQAARAKEADGTYTFENCDEYLRGIFG